MESQQLLPQCQLLQHEVFAGLKCANQPTEKVSSNGVMAKILTDFAERVGLQAIEFASGQNYGE